MVWIKWLGLLVATLAALAVGLMAYGPWRWSERSMALLERLESAGVPHAVARELVGLPAPPRWRGPN